MTRLLLSLLLLCCGFQSSNYATYCNSRFNFCIEYPNSFTKGQESDNGDGLVFLSKDKKAEIRAFGSLVVEEGDALQTALKTVAASLKVTYKMAKNNGFIISGTDKEGRIVYRKTVRKKIDYWGQGDTDVFQTLMISYPATQKRLYDSYCQQIAKSL